MRLKTSLIVLVLAACNAWAQSSPAPQKKAPDAKSATSAKKPTEVKPAAPVKKASQTKPAAPKNAPQAKPAKPANKAAQTKPAAPQAAQQKTAAAPVKKTAQPIQTKITKAKAAAPVKKTAKTGQPTTTKTKRVKKPAQRKIVTPKPAPAKAPETKAAALSTASTTPAVKRDVRRDPFISPIVTTAAIGAPRCQLGKGCLSIGEIVIKGTAKSEDGMLVIVENAAKKVYILRENDPVFNGFVAKITMDGVVFRENVMDQLGHTSTRDVVKKIPTTPDRA